MCSFLDYIYIIARLFRGKGLLVYYLLYCRTHHHRTVVLVAQAFGAQCLLLHQATVFIACNETSFFSRKLYRMIITLLYVVRIKSDFINSNTIEAFDI